jgi:hypothetical protein
MWIFIFDTDQAQIKSAREKNSEGRGDKTLVGVQKHVFVKRN